MTQKKQDEKSYHFKALIRVDFQESLCQMDIKSVSTMSPFSKVYFNVY